MYKAENINGRLNIFTDNGISWTICKQSASRSRQITTSTPHHSIFTGRILFQTPKQQCQSTKAQALKVQKNSKNTTQCRKTRSLWQAGWECLCRDAYRCKSISRICAMLPYPSKTSPRTSPVRYVTEYSFVQNF